LVHHFGDRGNDRRRLIELDEVPGMVNQQLHSPRSIPRDVRTPRRACRSVTIAFASRGMPLRNGNAHRNSKEGELTSGARPVQTPGAPLTVQQCDLRDPRYQGTPVFYLYETLLSRAAGHGDDEGPFGPKIRWVFRPRSESL
jgi:hypothetical protein